MKRWLKRIGIFFCWHHWHPTGDARARHSDRTCKEKRDAECQWQCCVCGRRTWMPSFIKVGGFIAPSDGEIASKEHVHD